MAHCFYYTFMSMEVITTHTNADFDSLASMLAAKKLYPNAVLVFQAPRRETFETFLSTRHFMPLR